MERSRKKVLKSFLRYHNHLKKLHEETALLIVSLIRFMRYEYELFLFLPLSMLYGSPSVEGSTEDACFTDNESLKKSITRDHGTAC